MKVLLAILVMFITGLTNASSFNEVIQVTGEGRSFEEARHNAFRKAIEYKIGTVIVFEHEQENLKLIRNDILAYSAGYVDNFKIISSTYDGNKVKLVVDVWVAESKLSRIILSNTKNITAFENQRHAAQHETYLDERNRSDRLIWSVMRHYPKRAFDIDQLPYQLRVDSNRNLSLIVPYIISWNQNFINSFNELMSNIDVKISLFDKAPGNISVYPIPYFFVMGRENYKFNDLNHIASIKNHMLGNREIRIRVLMKDVKNKLVIDRCYYPRFLSGNQRSFYDLGDPNKIILFGQVREKYEIMIPISIDFPEIFIRELTYIKLDVVAHENCNISTIRDK